MRLNSKVTLLLLLSTICILTLLPFLGLTDFHTKGEPREAIVAVSMLQSDNWVLPINNGGDIAYKPPLFHWAIAFLSLPFGEVSEYTSRLPSALAAIIITIATFLFYARRRNNNLAFLTALLFLSCFEVHRAAMASRVDMVLTLFIVTSLYQLYRWTERDMKGFPFVATLLMGAATLTKGPVGIILPCAVTAIYLLVRGKRFFTVLYRFIFIGIVSCILPAIWYYLAYKQGGDNFVNLVIEENFGRFLGKMSYESHEGTVLYYIYTTIAGFIPWSILVLFSLFTLKYALPNGKITVWWQKFKNYISQMDDTRLFTLLSFAVMFVFYCIPKSKRSVYLLPIYPFLCFFLAEYMFWLLKNRQKVWRVFGIFMSVLTCIVLFVFIAAQSKWITPEILPAKLSEQLGYYLTALNGPWNIMGIFCVLILVVVLYQTYRSKRDLSLNNRYLYTVVALFFWLQILLDAIILPDILNAKSMRPFAEKVKEEVPEGKIYSFVSTPMLRFFIVNFYNDNRIVEFEKEKPESGYLLVGKSDFNYINTIYGSNFIFNEVMKTNRKGNDVKDIIYLYKFEKR